MMLEVRPIDANALLKKLQEQQRYGSATDSRGRAKAILEVIHAPTIEAEPVRHGRWIFEKGDETTCLDGYICSSCKQGFHTHVPYFEDFDYCPNCGAKMDGGER